MADLQCYITTFNCGRSLIDVSYFARHLLDGLAAGRAASALPPDLIVLCLQEVAPIGYSFLGGSFLAPYFTRFSNAVQEATRSRFSDGASYETIAVRNVGMTAIMLFAKADVVQRINGLEAGGVGVGFWDMGNKGAVGLRLGFREEQTQLTFVAAHLAPMEDACDRRNQDWKAINEGLVFQKTKTISQSRPWNPQTAAGTESESEPLLSSATDDSNIKGKWKTAGAWSPSVLDEYASRTSSAGTTRVSNMLIRIFQISHQALGCLHRNRTYSLLATSTIGLQIHLQVLTPTRNGHSHPPRLQMRTISLTCLRKTS